MKKKYVDKRKKTFLLAFIIISILICISITVYKYYYIQKMNQKEKNEAKEVLEVNPSETEIQSLESLDEIQKNQEQIQEDLKKLGEEVQTEISNSNTSFLEPKGIEGLIYRNIRLLKQDNVVIFIAEVYNSSNEDISKTDKEVVLLDENNSELGRIKICIPEVKRFQATIVLSQTDKIDCDIQKAYYFEVQ